MTNPKDSKNPSYPVKVKNWKIYVDRNLCIGAATCIAIAPKAFILDNETKAIILDSIEKETEQAILDAARGCPVAAIIIEDENGSKIFPK